MKCVWALLVVLVVGSAVSGAEPPLPPDIKPKAEVPAPELSQLEAFAGEWACEVIGPASPPFKATRSRMTVQRDLGDFWYSGRVVEEAAPENPRPATRLFYWGHDDVVGKFVGGWLDSRGGWSTTTSFGWEEDKLVFFGHVTTTGAKVGGRETWTRPRDGELSRTYEVMGFADWNLLLVEQCRKVEIARP